MDSRGTQLVTRLHRHGVEPGDISGDLPSGGYTMNKKKRKNSGQWIGVLLYMLIGVGCGVLIMRYMDLMTGDSGHIGKQMVLFGVLALSVYAAIALQTVIHEAGHLVFGLATGYQFSSFRIFSWMWVKENGKLHFKRLSIAGTGGQCLMAPPELKDGKMPFLLYNFGGAIMNLIASAVFFGISLLLPSSSLLVLLFQVLALIGAAFAAMNGVPLRLGPVDNDGCNALSMMRSSEAVRAFYIQLKANELISKGTRLKDMPAEWFVVPGDEAMRNSIVASTGALCLLSAITDNKHYRQKSIIGSFSARNTETNIFLMNQAE